LLVDSDDVEDGELLEELSLADGVVLDSLELELELGEELDPLLGDVESLGLVVELEPEPLVASSLMQSSFAVPLSESQRGLLPYELDEPLVDESLDDDPEVEVCANAATGRANATAITANFTFIGSPWLTATGRQQARCLQARRKDRK
jgi:hypothetical protein